MELQRVRHDFHYRTIMEDLETEDFDFKAAISTLLLTFTTYITLIAITLYLCI